MIFRNVQRLATPIAVLGLVGMGAAACGTSSGPPSSAGGTPSAQSTTENTASTSASASAASSSPSSPSSETSASSPTMSATPPHQVSTAPASNPGGGSACTKNELGSGSWKDVPASEGAGHVAGDLAFQNTSGRSCTINGYPGITLTSASGAALPTTVTQFKTGSGTTSPVPVAPGSWVHSEIRYDPHIPGPTEPTTGDCEPTAAAMLVVLPGDSGSARVAVAPPTTFCDRGQLEAKPFAAGASSPAGG